MAERDVGKTRHYYLSSPAAGLVGSGDVLEIERGEVEPPPAVAPPLNKGPAPMRNLYTAALSYNGYTITDGALRLIVLLHAADLGFNAIEIAFMFSLYEVSELISTYARHHN